MPFYIIGGILVGLLIHALKSRGDSEAIPPTQEYLPKPVAPERKPLPKTVYKDWVCLPNHREYLKNLFFQHYEKKEVFSLATSAPAEGLREFLIRSALGLCQSVAEEKSLIEGALRDLLGATFYPDTCILMSAQGRKSLETLLQLSPESVTIRSKVISELRTHESKLNSRIKKDPKKAKDLSRKAWEAGEALNFLEGRKSKLNVETSFKKHMADDDFVDIIKQGTLIKSVYITDDIELRNRILETSIHYDRTNQVSMNLLEFNQFIESLLAAVSRDSKMSEVESLLRLDPVDASERHKYPYALLSVCNSRTKEHLGFWFSSSAPHIFP